ncbi:hypothetical protein CFC21_058954, partial [Triticum aestivum]
GRGVPGSLSQAGASGRRHCPEVSDQNFADDNEAEVGAESSKACKKRRLSSSSTYFTQTIQ